MTSRQRKTNPNFIKISMFAAFLFFAAVFLHVNFDASLQTSGSVHVMGVWAVEAPQAKVSGIDVVAQAFTGGAAWLMQPLFWVANMLLWIFLQFTTLLLVLAVTIFGWAVDPAASHNMLNMASVYTMWRMIRDFFNLFFILTILFIAFSTIFQVQAYNYKKLLWHLVLMALLVNFSFPVTRFIIDATNVPMYFFMESAFRDQTSPQPTQMFGTVFSASNLRQLLVPPFDTINNGDSKITIRLITNLVFMFLFSVSLLVLAVLFLIRLVMLTVLIIFSPVGFAGSAIPGFDKYAKQWWENLMKYALFGPSAMLILLVAVMFLKEFKVDQSSSQATLQSVAGNVTSDAENKNVIAAMATSIVPIILIWTAISVGQKMGIEGAAGVTSFAQKTSKSLGKNSAKWAGRGTSLGYGAGMRKVTTQRDKDGNVVARDWTKKVGLGKYNLGGVAESRGRKSYAAASIREEKRSQLAYRKNRRELLAQMTDDDLLKELNASKSGVSNILGKAPGKFYGLDADVSQTLIKKGAHKKLDSDKENAAGIMSTDGTRKATNGEVLQMLHGTLESVGDKDNLKTLESDRADVMLEAIRRNEQKKGTTEEGIKNKIKTKVNQWVADGEHKKASNVNIMNEKFVETLVDAMEVDKAMEKIAEMPSNVTRRAEEVAEAALVKAEKAGTIADFSKTEHWRKLGAGVSANAHKFFATQLANGKLSGDITDPGMMKAAKEYADKMKSARIERLSGEAAEAFAAVASVGYFQNAGDAKLSAETKKKIFLAGKDRSDPEIQEELRNSPKWKSFSASGGGSSRPSSFNDRDYIS
jgi:uncharacterized protein YjiS (DUF1127 family)